MKQPKINKQAVVHSHKLPESFDGQHTVVHIKKPHVGRRVLATSFVLFFAAIGGFASFNIWQKNSLNSKNINSNNHSKVLQKSTGLIEAQSTSLFTLAFENISFLPASGQNVNKTTPYPVSGGTYRVTRTMAPTDNQSWVPVTAPTIMHFTDGVWSISSSSDPSKTTQSRLPLDAKPGNIYYYRAEIQSASNKWSAVNDEVISFIIPKATIHIESEQGESAKLTLNWSGSADGELGNLYIDKCYSCVLVAADNQDMTSGMTVPLDGIDLDFFTRDGSSALFKQELGTTKYYALYNYLGTRYSEPVALTK